jgi:predicted metallopeptidase
MIRFEDVPEEITAMVENIQVNLFPDLEAANILVAFDLKKKVVSGKISIARIKKMTDELKYLAVADSGIYYDYLIALDKNVWQAIAPNDQARVIFHELAHTEVDFSKDNPYGIRDHEIQGFHCETEQNADDPKWMDRVSVIAESVWDPKNVEAPVTEAD